MVDWKFFTEVCDHDSTHKWWPGAGKNKHQKDALIWKDAESKRKDLRLSLCNSDIIPRRSSSLNSRRYFSMCVKRDNLAKDNIVCGEQGYIMYIPGHFKEKRVKGQMCSEVISCFILCTQWRNTIVVHNVRLEYEVLEVIVLANNSPCFLNLDSCFYQRILI